MGHPRRALATCTCVPMVTPACRRFLTSAGRCCRRAARRCSSAACLRRGVGDMCVCVGPPDVIAMGSFTVLIGGKPAAQMGDLTAHGGIDRPRMPDGADRLMEAAAELPQPTSRSA